MLVEDLHDLNFVPRSENYSKICRYCFVFYVFLRGKEMTFVKKKKLLVNCLKLAYMIAVLQITLSHYTLLSEIIISDKL